MTTKREAEIGYLSAFLHDNSIINLSPEDCGKLEPEMFGEFRGIFDQAQKLFYKGPVSLVDLIPRSTERTRELLAELDPYTSANWEFFHRAIFRAWAKETIDSACRQAQDVTFPDNLETIEKAITAVTMRESGSKTVVARDLIDPVVKNVIARSRAGGGIPGMKTGLNLTDAATLGLREGQFIVICARPSEGKSTIGWQIARFVARSVKVGVITLEDSKEQMIERGLAAEGNLDSRALSTGSFQAGEKDRMMLGIEAFHKFADNILIHEKPGMRLGQLLSEIRMMVVRGAKLIVVDYLQIVQVTGDRPKHEKVGEVSTSLKALARELKIPIVALAQLKRLEGSEHRPTLMDIQHSDQPGQDADQVWFLYHPRKDGKIEQSWLLISKARDGVTRDVKIEFDRPTLTIREAFPQ